MKVRLIVVLFMLFINAARLNAQLFGGQIIPPSPLTIGQYYQGGIIAYIDGTGNHGLIVSDIEYFALQGCDGIAAYNDNDGYSNTSIQFSGCNYPNVAVAICWNLNLNGYGDWYLPAKNQLLTIYQNIFSLGTLSMTGRYWSSTRYSSNWPWWLNTNGTFGYGTNAQGGYLYFRPVRNF